MSVNSTLHRNFVPELAALTKMVSKAVMSWKEAPTMEARLIIESNLLGQFEDVLSATQEIEKLTTNQYPDVFDLTPERRLINDKLKMNLAKLRAIVQMYLEYFNKSRSDILDLIGSVKRCRQKLSTLKLWDRSADKWVVSEPFLNFDNLDMNFTNTAIANVVTSSGYLTLPLQEEGTVIVNRLKLLSGSNGIPGNSELMEVVTENRLPQFVIDGDQDTWFEYERMDSGPCELKLQFFFDKPDIVNGLMVEAVNLGDAINYKIEDIVYTKDNGKNVSISEMVSPDLPQDYYVVKTVGSESYWEIAHMPIIAASATIKFVQDHSYSVKMVSPSGRPVTRERYAIGIRKIVFKKNKFSKKGGINSKPQNIPEGMYGAACTAHAYPRNTNLFDLDMNVSIDNGETWQNDLLGLPEPTGETILLDGNPFDLVWSLKAERLNEAFKEAKSFSDEEPRLIMQSMQGTVSPNQNPATFKVKGKPYNKEVFAIQPAIAKKSSNQADAMSFGRRSFLGGDADRKLFFPQSLLELDVDSKDLRIFVNDIEWTRVYTDDTTALPTDSPPGLGWGNYYLSPDRSYVQFNTSNGAPAFAGHNLNQLLSVQFLLNEEKMAFEERTDGFYCKLEQLFDPDKENIRILKLPSGIINSNIYLPKDEIEINLQLPGDGGNVKYIKSVKFPSLEATETPWANLDVNSPFLQYHIDKINGVLYFNRGLTTSGTINVEHFTPSVVEEKDFEIWMDGSKPVGVIISPDSMTTKDMKDVLAYSFDEMVDFFGSGLPTGIAPVEVLDVETGVFDKKPDPYFANKKVYTLSEDKIIRGSLILSSEIFGYQNYPPPTEEPFVDGNIEFLGLTSMESEYAPAIDADSDGFVEFKLAAGRGYYAPLGILWKQPDGSNSTYFNSTSHYYNNGQTLRNLVAGGAVLDPATGNLDTGKAAWALDPEGLITVYIGQGNSLPGDISVSYYYTDPTFDSTNRFSVDYDKGTLYLSEPLDNSAKRSVSYKTASYSISYELAKEINKYEYKANSNTVEIRTENIASINNKIKIIWGKAPEDASLEELRDYFSPIIYTLGVRFQ